MQVIHTDLIYWMSRGKKKVKITPYPRPGKEKDKQEQTIGGEGSMPIDELRSWFKNKEDRRQENG